MKSYQETAWFEHQFWLQVLGDHARMIHDALAPDEQDYVNRASEFIEIFDQLLTSARSNPTGTELDRLNRISYEQANSIKEYKLNIVKDHLVGDIKIELSPTFINHMVNEVEEYIRILPYLIEQSVPPRCHPLHHHLVWLLDAAGHAGGISDSLDLVEKKLNLKSEYFTETFEQFYIKAVEMAGYLRSNVEQFPALSRFNEDVKLEIILFKAFLDELEELEMTNKLLGTLSELMADHMAREECYYLMKLAESSEMDAPECNPLSPRPE
ncbi:DUF2935 domain-containing protein [Halalkalibacter urbisdiaboli]|uniref:DUF2935 domain-containing protein n=1 Tax=Halalkalibacter urbisdiaboli TaxID=1960589 RepID=UPI000B44B3FB|nr:DUF2935 domain-containing protein [Halalkalibacter urbisdiaboli]